MSAESELIALLTSASELADINANKVFLNAADERTAVPYVVVSSARDNDKTLEGSTDTVHYTYTIACWGRSATEAEAVADAVEDVIDDANNGVEVLTRTGGFDQDTSMDVSVLLADEWRQA